MTVDVVVQSIIDENFVERRPIFSEDGNSIYVIDRDCVKEFNVQTSECSCTFFQDGGSGRQAHSNIVGIAFYENYLYACTSNCTFLRWSRKGDLILKATVSTKNSVYITSCLKRSPKSENCEAFDMTVFDYYPDSGDYRWPSIFAFIRDTQSREKVIIQTYKLNFDPMKWFCYRGSPNPKLLALGCVDDKHFIVTALGREVLVYNLGEVGMPVHKFTNRVNDWAVVRVVPNTDSIAAGDSKGRVSLYQHVLTAKDGNQHLEDSGSGRKRKHDEKRRRDVAIAIYHWHTYPVNDIAFSPSGTQMYTGSEENVLVRWNIKNPNIREYTPRIQSAIQHITVSPNNTTIAVSLVDNGIALMSAQMRLQATIQKLTWYLAPAPGQQVMPAKMSYDPNSRCVVMNGRYGHLQFVSLDRNELIHSMDVCECNYVKEPHITLYLMQVVKVALSDDGRWMATVEMRDDQCTAKEVLMKMWKYDAEQKRFVMNTCINLPHYDYKVTAMRFQPTRSLSGERRSQAMLVTSGADHKFRVWRSGKMLVGAKGEYATTWTNDRVGFYRDKEGGPVAFSYDGSVLAVGFGSSLTVWNSDTIEMSSSLTRGAEVIKFIEFEQKPYSHVVVTASSSMLQVWDLLSLSTVWCVRKDVTALTADPLSEHFAAFTADNQLFVFKANEHQPLSKMAAVKGGKQKVMAAIFVPREEGDEGVSGLPSWLLKSKLYYVTESQELLAVDVETSSTWQSLPTVTMDDSSQAMRGPFAQLTAKKVRQESRDAGQTDFNRRMGSNLVEQSTRKLLNLPIHAVPHISLLCEDFLACQLSAKHELSDSFQIELKEAEVEDREEQNEKTKKKKKKKEKKEKLAGNVEEIDDMALENLFSIDTEPCLDLNMDCE